MDERVEHALDNCHYRATLARQRANLKLRIKSMLTLPAHGGLFNVTPELMCFVDLLLRNGRTSHVLLDVNDNPILIDDLQQFQDNLMACHAEVLNEYHREYSEFRRQRNVKALIA